MIMMDGGNRQPEWDCNVFPLNLTRERAEQLLGMHSSELGCEVPKCTVRYVTLLTLAGAASELQVARARAARRAKGLRR